MLDVITTPLPPERQEAWLWALRLLVALYREEEGHSAEGGAAPQREEETAAALPSA